MREGGVWDPLLVAVSERLVDRLPDGLGLWKWVWVGVKVRDGVLCVGDGGVAVGVGVREGGLRLGVKVAVVEPEDEELHVRVATGVPEGVVLHEGLPERLRVMELEQVRVAEQDSDEGVPQVTLGDPEQLRVAVTEQEGLPSTEVVGVGLWLCERLGVMLELRLGVRVVAEQLALGLKDALRDHCCEALWVWVGTLDRLPEAEAEDEALLRDWDVEKESVLQVPLAVWDTERVSLTDGLGVRV